MKKLIGNVTIMGKKWRIYETDELDQSINGLTFFDKPVIYIRSGLDKKTFRKIYFHELHHASLMTMEWFVTGMDPQLEEVLVNQLAMIAAENYEKIIKHLK